MRRNARLAALACGGATLLALTYVAVDRDPPAPPAAPTARRETSRPPTPAPTTIPEPPAPPVRLGLAVQPDQVRDRRVAALVGEHGITSVTPENAMKARRIHPERKRYVFKGADEIVAFAQRHRLRVRGHTLVWHRDTPEWVENLSSRSAARTALREHIRTVMGRYRGKVAQWDVVNEAFDTDGSLRSSPWRRALGEDYVALAFRYAAEADPAAELFYNDFSIETTETAEGRAKTRAVLRLVADLRSRSIRIDGIGLEAHADYTYPGTAAGFEANLRRFGEQGLTTEITELDIPGSRGPQAQADRYAEIGAACARVPTCTGVTTWGVHDGSTWRAGEKPLLFDAQLRPKSALAALRTAILR